MIKEDEMGGAGRTHGKEKMHSKFLL